MKCGDVDLPVSIGIVAVSLVTSYFKEFLLRDQKAIAFAEPAHQQLFVSDLDSDY